MDMPRNEIGIGYSVHYRLPREGGRKAGHEERKCEMTMPPELSPRLSLMADICGLVREFRRNQSDPCKAAALLQMAIRKDQEREQLEKEEA